MALQMKSQMAICRRAEWFIRGSGSSKKWQIFRLQIIGFLGVPFHATIRALLPWCDNSPHFLDMRQFAAEPSTGILPGTVPKCRKGFVFCKLMRAVSANNDGG
ncbi:MAG: hypothetical protein IPO00_07755 [Betaproteobacteria bacterium]|nr:hypothetical protein [Betaproteobacteria bacterium]